MAERIRLQPARRIAHLALTTSLVLLGIVVAGGNPAVGAGDTFPPHWQVQPTPNPQPQVGSLSAVSCTDASFCLSVGYSLVGGDVTPLFERWLGSGAWVLDNEVYQPTTPAGDTSARLDSVSCVSHVMCMAVGSSWSPDRTTKSGDPKNFGLIEQFDGAHWTQLSLPFNSIQSYLTGVSCAADDACVAVGYTVHPSTTPGGPDRNAMLALRWNGSSWNSMSTPFPANDASTALFAVSCSAAQACIAVGETDSGAAFAERYDGGPWTYAPLPAPGYATSVTLTGISCPTPTTCAASGEFGYTNATGFHQGFLDERMNGTTWTYRLIPGLGNSTVLGGESCTSQSSCVIVGSVPATNGSATLIERWNGVAWTAQIAAEPAGARTSWLSGVSCNAATQCAAVGGTQSTTNLHTLAMRFNGRTWSVQSTPNRAITGVNSFLAAVSCPTAKMCMAVGWNRGVHLTPLSERWDGTTWKIMPSRIPPGSTETVFNAVSCVSATMCMAVGYTSDSSGKRPLAERWNGVSWTPSKVPFPSNGIKPELRGVSCTTANFCMAVGSYVPHILCGGIAYCGSTHALADRWNGSTWTYTQPALEPFVPFATQFSSFSAVSCTSTSACMAVGTGYEANATIPEFVPYSQSWNGNHWRYSGAVGTGIVHINHQYFQTWTGVSCTTGLHCIAVGYVTDLDLGDITEPAAARYDFGESGLTWTDISPPFWNSSNYVYVPLSGVSCTTMTDCIAVGSVIDGFDNNGGTGAPQQTLAYRWDGEEWTVTFTEDPSSTDDSLWAVSCVNANTCTAVGVQDSGELGEDQTLAERYH